MYSIFSVAESVGSNSTTPRSSPYFIPSAIAFLTSSFSFFNFFMINARCNALVSRRQMTRPIVDQTAGACQAIFCYPWWWTAIGMKQVLELPNRRCVTSRACDRSGRIGVVVLVPAQFPRGKAPQRSVSPSAYLCHRIGETCRLFTQFAAGDQIMVGRAGGSRE